MHNRETTFLWLVFLLMAAQVYNVEKVYGQQKIPINFGKVKLEDFNIYSPVIDSNTNAVVIADVGKTEFIPNTNDNSFSFVFTRQTRIKIINKKGFDAAVVTIPLYVGVDGRSEKMERLKATTYNIENEKVKETDLEKTDLFTERRNKNLDYKKFTFPALKEGSIIEYSYEVKSDFFFNLQSWYFQGEYPVLWSQYDANIPEFFKYAILAQGYHSFLINKVNNYSASFSFSGRESRAVGDNTFNGSRGMPEDNSFKIEGIVDYHTWIMKDVPALKPEPYTTTVNNAIAKIEFQLNEVRFPNSTPTYYMASWEKMSKDLWEDVRFGAAIDKPNNWLDDEVKNIVKGAVTQHEKVQKVYDFMQRNFSCNLQNRMYITDGLKEVFKNRTGSVADINMLLIAMLRNIKIDAEPVILSTRSNGYTHEIYPLMDRFNYVIAHVMLDNSAVYLDATEPRLAFGKLPSELYNGHARLISKDRATAIYFSSDSLKEAGSTNVFISNLEKGGVQGNIMQVLGFYETLDLRDKMAKTSTAQLVKTIKESYPEEIEVENVTIDSLKILDQPVTLKYDLNIKLFGQADIVYFNPMLAEAIKKNPFAAAHRFYPVELPYTKDDIYSFHMEIPQGYKIDELPKSVRFNLNENEGMFEYIISADAEMIQMKCRLVVRKTRFLNDDYESIREFYSLIVKKQSEQIVFKKIK